MTLNKDTSQRSKYISTLIFIALFVNEDIMIFGTMKSNIMSTLKFSMQFLVVLLAFFQCFKKKTPINNKSIVLLIEVSLCIFMTMIFNNDFRVGYFFQLLIYVMCVLFLWYVSIDDIFEMLFKCITVICYVSIIMFVIRTIYPQLLSKFPVIENDSGYKYYSIGICNVPVHTGGFLRNFGAFREPGVFQMFIIVSLMYGTFSAKKISAKHLIIQIIALITTFSTTGYISLGFYTLAVLFQKNKEHVMIKNKSIKYTILIFVCVAMVYLILGTDVLYSEGYGSVFGKLFHKSASTNSRMAGIEINLDIFKKNPLFGKGISYVDSNFTRLSYLKYGVIIRENANTLLIQLARYGILFFLIYVTKYYKFFVSYFTVGKLATLCLILSFGCLLVGQNLGYSFLFSLPMFYEPERGEKSEGENFINKFR